MFEISIKDLFELLSERRKTIGVATLPYEVSQYFGCSKDTVYLSSQSLAHILQRHGEHITAEDIATLPSGLRRGLWVSDMGRPEFAVVTYVTDNQARYLSAVKVTKDRRQAFVTTLHRAKPKQIASKIKRGKVLRPHW